MFNSDNLNIWNLTPGVNTLIGSQEIFNIVGSLNCPDKVKEFNYSINKGPERPVFFNSLSNGSGRLANPGDFNIDTIQVDQLESKNEIDFRLLFKDGVEEKYKIEFPVHFYNNTLPSYKLDLKSIGYSQEAGQIVDGKWHVNKDEQNEKCLEILKKDAGHDRIILFGRYDWTSNYEITARICVTSWTHITHNVGLLFKWNPHLQGDGTNLPVQWSTGLGYFYSLSKGLRIRFGENVHVDSSGKKQGDYVLKEKPLSFSRYIKGKMLKIANPLLRNGNRSYLFGEDPFSQIIPGKHYYFKMHVHPEEYRLTVWEMGGKEPSPQLVVSKPDEILKQGSVGIIAYHCGVRIYEYNVSQI
ncbi:MAG: hypothetical protein ACR2NW_05370 [Thermodesulfobacteriota bacterium]